jgi:hypothetical protein
MKKDNLARKGDMLVVRNSLKKYIQSECWKQRTGIGYRIPSKKVMAWK